MLLHIGRKLTYTGLQRSEEDEMEHPLEPRALM